jgi:hypothetical protein
VCWSPYLRAGTPAGRPLQQPQLQLEPLQLHCESPISMYCSPRAPGRVQPIAITAGGRHGDTAP